MQQTTLGAEAIGGSRVERLTAELRAAEVAIPGLERVGRFAAAADQAARASALRQVLAQLAPAKD